MNSALFDDSDNNEEDDVNSVESFVMVDNNEASSKVEKENANLEATTNDEMKGESSVLHGHDVGSQSDSVTESALLSSLASKNRPLAETALRFLKGNDSPFEVLTAFQVTQALNEILSDHSGLLENPPFQLLALAALHHVMRNAVQLFPDENPRQLDGPALTSMFLQTMRAADDAEQKNEDHDRTFTCLQSASVDCSKLLFAVASKEVNVQVCQWIVQRAFLRHRSGPRVMGKDLAAVRLMEASVKWLLHAAGHTSDPQLWDELLRGTNEYKDMFWYEEVWGHETLVDAVHLLMTLASKPSPGKDKGDPEIHANRRRIYQNGICGILRWQAKYPDDEQVQTGCLGLYGNIAIDPSLAQEVAISTLTKLIIAPLRRCASSNESEVRYMALAAMFNMIHKGTVYVLVLQHCELIAETLHHMLTAKQSQVVADEEVMIACRLVKRICNSNMPRWHFFPDSFTGVLQQVMAAMQQYPKDQSLHRVCMFVLQMSTVSTKYNTFLVDHNAIGHILSSIQTHITDTEEILRMALVTLKLLATSEEGMDLVLLQGGVALSVQIVQLHVDHPAVLATGLGLLFRLSTSSEDSRVAMRREGILPLLDKVLQQFDGKAEGKSPDKEDDDSSKPPNYESRAAENARLLRRNLASSSH